MRVVTGAGKTVLALYLYGRLLDRSRSQEIVPQLIIVVPRVALVEQWRRELHRTLDLSGLALGVYHGEERCLPSAVDVLIITQDSARNVLPRVRSRRPTLLIADECHRLGAPAASQVFRREYDWTLGLSATPERGGDFGFETVLTPKLGPIVWTYGYADAVRDGIIARFRLGRLQIQLTEREKICYVERSVAVKQLYEALRNAYPSLRNAHGRRYFQTFGHLRNHNPGDERFDAFTAAATARRGVVHLAEQKLAAVETLIEVLDSDRRVLVFHELISAADEILALLRRKRIAATVYHSALSPKEREDNLRAFRGGHAKWLVACRSLDEGLDIPAVDTVILVSVQRLPVRSSSASGGPSDARPTDAMQTS